VKPKIVLIIDDEEIVLKSISKLLRKNGYDVLICHSGEEALEKIKKDSVNLIVCDIRMPTMSGVETLKGIRDLLKEKNQEPVPEIVITGYAEDQTNKEIEALKVAEYIYKPFDVRDFLTSIRKHLRE